MSFVDNKAKVMVFLGAGASAALDLPTSKAFPKHIQEKHGWSTKDLCSICANCTVRAFPVSTLFRVEPERRKGRNRLRLLVVALVRVRADGTGPRGLPRSRTDPQLWWKSGPES